LEKIESYPKGRLKRCFVKDKSVFGFECIINMKEE